MFTPDAPKKSSRLCLKEGEIKRKRISTPTSSPNLPNFSSPTPPIISHPSFVSLTNSFLCHNFVTVESLGQGDFGEVKKVVKRSSSEQFAIKISKVDPTKVRTGLHYVKDHLQEVRIHSSISSHNNIAQFYRAWKEEGQVYMQIELCVDSLDGHWRKQNNLTLKEIQTVYEDMIRALHHLSSLHIIHLDVKPHNILISANGIFKLADFGKAINMSDASSFSLEDGSFGDGRYAAPEILAGQFTAKGDLFSLAISISQVSVPADAPLAADEWNEMKHEGKMPDRVAQALPGTSALKDNIKSMMLPLSSRPSVEVLFNGVPTAAEEETETILRASTTKTRYSLSASCERKLRKNRSPLVNVSQKSGAIFHTDEKFFEMERPKRVSLTAPHSQRSSFGGKRRLHFDEMED